MFDLTAGTIDRPFRDAHASATVLSIATHVAVIGSIAWVLLFSVSDKLPEVPSMMAFVAPKRPLLHRRHHHRRRLLRKS